MLDLTSGVHLSVNPPALPMLAKRVSELEEGGDWVFEPRWDGFRALVFRDGDEILIQSRHEKPLSRYFPLDQFFSSQFAFFALELIAESFDETCARTHTGKKAGAEKTS
jgi:ATP-dependent DNA ligase